MSCGNCCGETSELRRRTLVNGSVQFTRQCLTCGRATSNPMPRATVSNPSAVPRWDDGLQRRYEDSHSAQRKAEQDAARAAWFEEHNAYLQTPDWRRRRQAVMQRAHGFCEGCGKENATQVHHLSYEHWKEEFLWELVAICDDCHERIHPHMADSEEIF